MIEEKHTSGLPKLSVPKYKIKIPSTSEEIEFRPFLVKEEKILIIAMEQGEDKDKLNAIQEIVSECTFGKVSGDETPLFDIEYLFLNLRAKSKGEIVNVSYKCPECGEATEFEIDLTKIQCKKPKKNSNKVLLDGDIGIAFKYPSIKSLENVNTQEKDTNQIFSMITNSIDYIYDKEQIYKSTDHTEEQLNEFIEELSHENFQKVQKFFEEIPKVNYKLDFKCSHCSFEKEMMVEGLQNFLA